MTVRVIEQLSLEKAQAQAIARSRLGILGVLALEHGTQKEDGRIELRISRAEINELEGHSVNQRSLKRGGVVITVTPVDGGEDDG